MAAFDDFMRKLLPGNYALTKSMELTKVENSGTLWYTKKFLTLYYFIFLTDDIFTMTYRNQIIDIFDTFISSLDESVRLDAELFFYPENETINFKSESFNTFINFASKTTFESQEERNKYYQDARKYYFSFLMGSGGQSGTKKVLKEKVQQPGFVYSHENIDAIIYESVVNNCVAFINEGKNDNSIGRIISKKAIKLLEKERMNKHINRDDVLRAIKKYPKERPEYRGIENDMIAFIRNERQILYYYGFFHSKSLGANEYEFSSLTPIGELALRANALEFLAIWEHQKIKMISQPATADINEIAGINVNADNFDISFSPYIDILRRLLNNNTLSLDEYKFIVSRKKSSITLNDWQDDEGRIYEKIEDIKNRVEGFGRIRDIKDEDGRKELLKYLLGIRDDLKKDKSTNPLGLLKFTRSTVVIDNESILSLLFSIYSVLDDYKIEKYETVFVDSRNDLKKRYEKGLLDERTDPDGRVKIYWDLYNIHPDKLIMLGAVLTISLACLGIYSITNIPRETIPAICTFMGTKFNSLLKTMNISSQSALRQEISKTIDALKTHSFEEYMGREEDDEEIIANYRTESAADLIAKIKKISSEAVVVPAENRDRNTILISLLKSYYIARFAGNSSLRCECCGGDTFINTKGESYMEFHHLIPFGIAYGPDHYLNLFGVCPSCHRKLHYINMDEKQNIYEMINAHNYLRKNITERLIELRKQNLLRSYHLEFLLEDKAITIEEYNAIAA